MDNEDGSSGITPNHPDITLKSDVLMDDEPNTLSDILRKLQKSISDENFSSFNVYREDIFNCCIRAMRRKTFSPFNKINVIFTDCDNKTEEAIDAGGPKREMFRLVLSYFGRSSTLFASSENKEDLEQKNYFNAGRLIALAIVHVGLGPRFFSEAFFACLSKFLKIKLIQILATSLTLTFGMKYRWLWTLLIYKHCEIY